MDRAREAIGSQAEHLSYLDLSASIPQCRDANDLGANEVRYSRRRSPRFSVSREIAIRRLGSAALQVKIIDASMEGCKVEIHDIVAPADSLIARLPGLEPLGATVQWVNGPMAGLHFRRSIHSAVFDQLLTRLI
jgi:hypothetical protein